MEKLRLAVKGSLWEEECSNGHHRRGVAGGYVLNDYYDYHNEFYDMDFDEKDDENWKPMKAFAKTEDKTRERQRQLAERTHQRALILQVRELFGRLKDLKQLRELEIEWG